MTETHENVKNTDNGELMDKLETKDFQVWFVWIGKHKNQYF